MRSRPIVAQITDGSTAAGKTCADLFENNIAVEKQGLVCASVLEVGRRIPDAFQENYKNYIQIGGPW